MLNSLIVSINGITGMAAGVATFLATPTSANLKSAITDETGSGALVFATAPSLLEQVTIVGNATSTGLLITTPVAPGNSVLLQVKQGAVNLFTVDYYGGVSFGTANVGALSATSTNGAVVGLTVTNDTYASANVADFVSKGSGSAVTCCTISENGYFTTRKNSVPADGEVAASEVALWFDSSNGASKLMIKGKSADGTVVTGSVTLS